MAKSHEAVMRRFIEDVINGGDESVLSEVVHPEYVYRSPGEELHGREGLTALLRGYREAFPDLRMAIDDIVVAPETTVTTFTLTGTQRGELLGIPASGRSMEIKGMVRSRFRDGMIAEEWEILDQLSLLEQLGAIRREA